MIVYKSTDASAPVITNANGSLIALLYACLVTGYGSKAGAGWTRAFTGTNLAAFRQGSGGNSRVLRVFDGGNDAYGHRRVMLRGYENMTAISTGTGPFPTTGQINGNGADFTYRHSSTVTAPYWELYASSSFFCLIVATYPDNGPTVFWEYMSFGTFFSYKPGDTFNDVLICNQNNTSSGGWSGQTLGEAPDPGYSIGVYVCRSDSGTAGARMGFIASPTATFSYIGQGSNFFPYPDRPTGGLLQAQPDLWADGYRRGRIPGLWTTYHLPTAMSYDSSLASATTWSGAVGSTLAGRTFKMIGPLAQSAYSGGYPTIETSNTWD